MTVKPTKKCKRCNIIMNQTSFHKSKNQKDGLQNYCRLCAKEYNNEYRARRAADGPLIEVQSKVCTYCKQEKPRSQFGRRTVSKDGLNYYCKPCWRDYLRDKKRNRA